MKSFLLTLLVCGIALAQQPAAPASGPQSAFQAAQKLLSEKLQTLAVVQSEFNEAAAKRDLEIYKLMAEAGVKPSECGSPASPFACVKTDPATGLLTFEKKKTEPEQLKK